MRVGMHVQMPANPTMGIMTIIILLLLMLLAIIVIDMNSKVGGVDVYMCMNSVSPQVKRGGWAPCLSRWVGAVSSNHPIWHLQTHKNGRHV